MSRELISMVKDSNGAGSNAVSRREIVVLRESRGTRFLRNIARDKYLILMCVGPFVLLVIFAYVPMYGIIIAFQDYLPGQRFFSGARWVGLSNFIRFFEGAFAGRLIRNTVLINVYSIVFGFPVPILFALALNEIRHETFKRICQTVSYLPHFISTVIIVGIVVNMFSSRGGVFNDLVFGLTGKRVNFFLDPRYFRALYIGSDIWAGFGWGSILYLSSIAAIDLSLYEAASIDGATRMQRIRHITIPGILPTVSLLLSLNIAGLFSLGPEKIILLYNPAIYETSDVISSYVYRAGLIGGQYSFGTAISLMNAVIAFLLLWLFNTVGRKLDMPTLW